MRNHYMDYHLQSLREARQPRQWDENEFRLETIVGANRLCFDSLGIAELGFEDLGFARLVRNGAT